MTRREVHHEVRPDPCLPWPPREWPPRKWPPRRPDDPETDVGVFNVPVDWMEYSHQQLYDMVHDRVDLDGADRVARTWSDLGNTLDRIAGDLRRAVETSSSGWSGEAAEQAREAATGLVHWSEGTAGRGHGLARLVADQADYVRVARDNMPKPLRPAEPGEPQFKAFAGGGFAAGGALVVDNGIEQERLVGRHQQAADVMRRLQHDSGEVYGSVPNFPPPRVERDPQRPPEPPAPPHPPEPAEPQPDGPDGGTTASASGGAGAALAHSQTLAPGSSSGTGGFSSGSAGGDHLAAGGRAGTGVPLGPSGTPSAPSAAGAAPRGAMATGGMPVGAAGGGARPGGDTEHKSPSYLEEDEDLWGLDGPVVPPVIGEEPRRRGV